MPGRLVEAALHRRFLTFVLFGVTFGLGIWVSFRLPVDAFPDTSSIQVQVNTVAPALSGEEIEQQITQPVELALGGLPGLVNVRSISKFGLSQVTATFDDDTGIYDARQFVLERIGAIELPEGIDPPELGPISSGLGEVFAYIVRSENPDRTLEEVRTLHDWIIKPELRKVPGVAEVTAWGGFERQFHIIVAPEKLIEYGLSMHEVFETVQRNNLNVGGGQITQSGESLLVQGLGRVANIEEIGNIVLLSHQGVPVHVRDVAEVRVDSEIRRGAVTAYGRGEAVLGLGYMLMGGNSREVARALREKLESAKGALPDDVEVEIAYDRTDLVHHVLDTVRENLIAGAVLVSLTLFFVLGSLRAGLLVAITIPMAMLFAVLGMNEMAIAASLLSLGAIDFGILVDGSVVMTDLHLRALATRRRELGRKPTWPERAAAIAVSSKEMARPVLFGMGVILVVFLPVLSLEGQEGKMFQPMAWTFIFALLGALVIAIFLTPALSYWLLPAPKSVGEGFGLRPLRRVYEAALSSAMQWRGVLVGAVVVALAGAVSIGARLGGEFLPRLSEGAIVMNVIRLPGIAIEESVALNTRMEQILLESFPDEIDKVWSRTGAAEVATDPMGIELSDTFITLRPREQWRRAGTQTELVQAIETTLHDIPGQNIVFSQPIELRMNELTAGIRSDVGVKIIGDDFSELDRLAQQVQRVLSETPGAADVSLDQLSGLPMLQVDVREDALARNGIAAADVLSFVSALGGEKVGDIFEGQRRFPLVVRLPDSLRTNASQLADTLVPTDTGLLLPLRELADVHQSEGLANINREWGRRVVRVQVNMRGRDVLSFIQDAEQRIREQVEFPEGYLMEWSGQFEHLLRAQQRLMVVVPITLGLVFMLLYVSMGRIKDVLLVYTGIPFAVVGGVAALYYRDIPFSVSAAVGFIALCGIAVLNGQVMIAAIRGLLGQGRSLREAVVEGAGSRLRPVLATSITDALGFLPMALSTGIGAEVQRPLATVVVGGVCTSTLLTLVVLPIVFWSLNRKGN